jgi:hypothetical protein
MSDEGMVVLQDCTDFLKVEPGLISETCPLSLDGNQVIDVKVEEASDTHKVEDPLLITLPGIKVECEVSYMYVSMSVENCVLLHTACGVPGLFCLIQF